MPDSLASYGIAVGCDQAHAALVFIVFTAHGKVIVSITPLREDFLPTPNPLPFPPPPHPPGGDARHDPGPSILSCCAWDEV